MEKLKNSNAKAQHQHSPLCYGGYAQLSLAVMAISGGGDPLGLCLHALKLVAATLGAFPAH